jgi:hypothetical protein
MALDTSFFEQHQDAAQNQAAIDARYFNQAAAAASQHAASNEVLIWEWIVCIALIVSILIILEIWLKIPILKKIKNPAASSGVCRGMAAWAHCQRVSWR